MNRYRYLAMGSLCVAAGCAAVAEDGSEIGSVDQDVINGSTDFTGLAFQQQRTLHVRTPPGTVCSATLLLPNVLMTARHCVTIDATPGGTLAAPARVRARILARAPAPATPPAVDVCDGPGRDPTCAVGARIVEIDSSTDMVFVGLAGPLSLNGDTAMFTPLELSSDISGYVGDNLRVSGWGMNTCGGGIGVLRWAFSNVEDVDDGGRIRVGPVNNRSPWKGDSGGPLWGTRTFPPASLSVAARGDCDTLMDGSSLAKDSLSVPVANHLAQSRVLFARAAALSDFTDPLNSFASLDVVGVAPNSIPIWSIVGGHLKMTTNSGPSIVLVRDEIAQRVLGGVYSVTVSSTDNDTTGVAFSFFDRLNFMTCEVNAQTHKLEATMVRNGTRTVVASTTWNGDYSPSATVTADLTPVVSNTFRFPIRCQVSGGGVATTSVTASNDTMPAGRVGIFNSFLDEATYTSFVVNQAEVTLPPPPPPPPPPPHMCGIGQKCCEPAANGGCELCFPEDLTCP
jgi:hypothetical protein